MNRHSRQREKVFRIVQSTRTHPTAEWVFEKVRKEMPRISLGTVYRNLRLMSMQGTIRELQIGGSQTRYDSHCQDHQHFICVSCQMIVDLENTDSSENHRSIERKYRCHIDSYRLDYFGLCRRCRKNRGLQKKENTERNGKKVISGRP